MVGSPAADVPVDPPPVTGIMNDAVGPDNGHSRNQPTYSPGYPSDPYSRNPSWAIPGPEFFPWLRLSSCEAPALSGFVNRPEHDPRVADRRNHRSKSRDTRVGNND